MGFFQTILTSVDENVAGFVQAVFIQLSPMVHTLWRLMVIAFIALYGYKVMLQGGFKVSHVFIINNSIT